MSKQKQNRHDIKLLIGVLVLLANAWLLPTTAVMAASASSGFTVSVEVVETVSIDTGKEWHELAPHHEYGVLQSEFVTQAASPQLETDTQVENADYKNGLPLGNENDSGCTGDAAGDGMHMLISATKL